MRDILGVDEIFMSKPVMLRAFNSAKACTKGKSKYSDDYIEFREFRKLLSYLRQYFEYYIAFKRVDSSGDRRIDLGEFISAVPSMEKWVGKNMWAK